MDAVVGPKQRRSKHTRPFLRWVGGKRVLAEVILSHFPDRYGRYYELFLGSGAVFFRAQPQRATLVDQNHDLITTFRVVRDDVERLIRWLMAHQDQSMTAFYEMRAYSPTSTVGRAGRLIYLNRMAFNGVWRVNAKGEFNVPFGGRPRRDLVEAEKLRKVARALQGTTLDASDFEVAARRPRHGDLVYLDPPYTVRHSENGFHRYNDVLFSWADQERLAKVATRLQARGVKVIVSNANHPDIETLYNPACFEWSLVTRTTRIAADRGARGDFTEGLLVSRNGG